MPWAYRIVGQVSDLSLLDLYELSIDNLVDPNLGIDQIAGFFERECVQ